MPKRLDLRRMGQGPEVDVLLPGEHLLIPLVPREVIDASSLIIGRDQSTIPRDPAGSNLFVGCKKVLTGDIGLTADRPQR